MLPWFVGDHAFQHLDTIAQARDFLDQQAGVVRGYLLAIGAAVLQKVAQHAGAEHDHEDGDDEFKGVHLAS